MTDELDRILLSEEPVTVTDRFATSVMRAVRRYCDQMPAIRFPWGRFATGLAGGLFCVAVSILILLPEGLPHCGLVDSPTWTQITQRFYGTDVFCIVVTLVGSLLAVRLSVEFTSE
jgi:hypothetical protein